MNGESTSMVWPTLGSRTAKERNRTSRLSAAKFVSAVSSLNSSSSRHLRAWLDGVRFVTTPQWNLSFRPHLTPSKIAVYENSGTRGFSFFTADGEYQSS